MDIIELLKEKIQQEKEKKRRAIVFWYDPAMQVSIYRARTSHPTWDAWIEIHNLHKYL